MKWEVYADESWTHSEPKNRYWTFFGGILGSEPELSKLDTILYKVKIEYDISQEVKWSNISKNNLVYYLKLIETFFNYLKESDIKYRQSFLCRSYVYCGLNAVPKSEIDVQFKIYYQFLKHAFGFSCIPKDEYKNISVFFRLDKHSSKQHTNKLKELCEQLPNYWNRNDLKFYVSYLDSSKSMNLQICDLLMGAAGFWGNKLYLRRNPGQRGMAPLVKIRAELAKFIYTQFSLLNNEQRGKKAFNWFETTGHDGDVLNRFNHKIRIWKFVPYPHQRDLGWQNDHLDKQGRFQGSRINPKVISSPQNEFNWE